MTDSGESSITHDQIKESPDQDYVELISLCKTLEPFEAQMVLNTELRRLKSDVNIIRFRPLIRAMQVSNYKDVREEFLKNNGEALKAEIDEFGNTIFHLLVQKSPTKETMKLLKMFVSQVKEDVEVLQKENVQNVTALDVAASAGNTEAVREFVTVLTEKERNLSSRKGDDMDSLLPVQQAAVWGKSETIRYLLSVTDSDYTANALLLKLLVKSNFQGIALELLKQHSDLADPNKNPFWTKTVNRLSKKYLAFPSGRKLGFWGSLIYQYIPVKVDEEDGNKCSGREGGDIEMQISNCLPSSKCSRKFRYILLPIAAIYGESEEKLNMILWAALIWLVPGIRKIHDEKLKHMQTIKIVEKMILSKEAWTYRKAVEKLKKPVLRAARLGIYEFVDVVLKAYENSVLFSDHDGHNIFLLAVLHRKEKVFSLLHDQVASIKDHTNYIKDKKKNNILHLAGKLVPSSRVAGAALKMQRELQWFKGIKHLFQPFLQERRNESGQTPAEMLTEEHRKLVEDGEKWMRDTATSCSVVAALIITIIFAAAFTVPGGINENGIPVYLNKMYFRIFVFSIAIGLFSSTTSVQMFLGMLTARYAEEDFLEALPRKLIIGLITLFLSSVSVMVAFGAAFCIVLSHPWKWVIILICLLGSLPITLFASMQFPLLVDMCKSTYGPSFLNPKK